MSLKHRINVGNQLSVSLKATLTLRKVEWSTLAQQSGMEDQACYVLCRLIIFFFCIKSVNSFLFLYMHRVMCVE